MFLLHGYILLFRRIVSKSFYYTKYSALKGTDKTDNLTCEIIYDGFTCEYYRFSNNP